MKKIYILVFCILLIGCSENKLTSENINEDVNVDNQILNEVVEDNEVVEENQVIDNDTSTQDSNSDEEVFNSFIVTIRVEQLNVRSDPNIESEKISKVTLDEQYMVQEKYVNDETGEYWYQIELDDGSIGWIAGWFASKSGEKFVELYSDMNLESDRMAFIEMSELPVFRLSGIYSSTYTMKWYEAKFLGQTLYCNDYDGDNGTVTWPIIYKTDYDLEEFVFSEENPGEVHFGYREVFIESNEGLIYIDTEQRKVYKEDKALGPTSFVLDKTLSDNRAHRLPDGFLFISDYRSRSWLYGHEDSELWCYEIIDNRLTEKKVFQLEFTESNQYVHAYDSPHKAINYEVSKYEYSGYVEEKDILGYRRDYNGYSSTDAIVVNVDGKEMYASYNANTVDHDTTVVLPNNDSFNLPAKSTIIKSPLYKKGYINYRTDNLYYTKNYKSDFEMPYSRLFYINDNQHMIIQNESQVYIYDVRSSEPVLLKEFESHNLFSEISEWEDFLFINSRLSSDVHLKRTGDSYELLYNDKAESPVFETMDFNSPYIGYDTLENRSTYDTVLQVLDDRMVVWYKSNEGYILRDIFNRYDYNEGYTSGYGYDQIVNSKGQLVSGNLSFMSVTPTEVIDSPYIIVYSSKKYYSIHLETLEMAYIGSSIKHIEGTNYIMTYSENDNGSVVDLYRIGQNFDLIDSYNTNMIGGKLSSWYTGSNFVMYSDYEGEISVSNFLNLTTKFKIRDNALNPNAYEKSASLNVYESANYKSRIIKTLNSTEMITPIPIDRFQLMNGEIILWYEVEIEGKTHYIHKKLKEMEYAAYDHEMLEILLEDDSIVGHSTGGECAYYLVYDNLGHEGYLSIYHAWEGIYGSVIDMKTGKIIYGMPYNPKFSPNGNHVFSYEFDYGNDDIYIKVFNILENDIEEVSSYNIGYWIIQSAEWISNDEVVIMMYDKQHNTEKTIRLVNNNNIWMLKDDYDEFD